MRRRRTSFVQPTTPLVPRTTPLVPNDAASANDADHWSSEACHPTPLVDDEGVGSTNEGVGATNAGVGPMNAGEESIFAGEESTNAGKDSVFAISKTPGEPSAAAPAPPAPPSILPPPGDLEVPMAVPVPDLTSPVSPIPGVLPESGPVNVAPIEVVTDLPPDERHGAIPPPATPADRYATPEQIALDIAFRVIADHIRTLSFAIADGIAPGNTDRHYVLRRILRRAVRYGRTLGFTEPFFYKLVDVLARTMGDPFPELRTRQKHIEEVLKREEEAFNKTLDRGI